MNTPRIKQKSGNLNSEKSNLRDKRGDLILKGTILSSLYKPVTVFAKGIKNLISVGV